MGEEWCVKWSKMETHISCENGANAAHDQRLYNRQHGSPQELQRFDRSSRLRIGGDRTAERHFEYNAGRGVLECRRLLQRESLEQIFWKCRLYELENIKIKEWI